MRKRNAKLQRSSKDKGLSAKEDSITLEECSRKGPRNLILQLNATTDLFERLRLLAAWPRGAIT